MEYVFGFMKRLMGGLIFRGVRIIRAKTCMAITNLTYNIARFIQIHRYHPDWITVP